MDWHPNGRELTFKKAVRPPRGAGPVRQSFHPEIFLNLPPRLWAGKKDMGTYFDLAPGGERFAAVQAEATEQKGPPHVTFLLNFFDELRRRAPAGK